MEDHFDAGGVYLFGDFNLPHVLWIEDKVRPVSIVQRNAVVYKRDAGTILSDTVACGNLFQENLVLNENSVLLNLVFISDKSIIVM